MIQSTYLLTCSTRAVCWIISPTASLYIALLFCFPLGKGGQHHLPTLQVSLLQGFEDMVQLSLVTDDYFKQSTGPSSRNK